VADGEQQQAGSGAELEQPPPRLALLPLQGLAPLI
jgi:hypothetical protein